VIQGGTPGSPFIPGFLAPALAGLRASPLLGLRTSPLLGLLAASLASLLAPSVLVAQEVGVNAELRPRWERRTPPIPAPPAADVTVRARLGGTLDLLPALRIHLTVQDVVTWDVSGDGEGWDPDPDVFAGYVELRVPAETELILRGGRQEISLGNERLVSRNNWGQRGQRFDGVRLFRPQGEWEADLFSVRVASGGGSLHGAHVALPIPAFHGGHGAGVVHLYALHSRARSPAPGGDATGERPPTAQHTGGGHARIQAGGVDWHLEGYLQRGTRRDRSVSAHQFALGGERALGPLTARLLYEHYSGDDGTPGRTGVFDRLRGTNHGLHGYADLFTDIPAHTGGGGLRDLNLTLTIPVAPGAELQVKGHGFRAVEGATLPSTRFGEEMDLVLTVRPRSGVALEGGLSRVRAGPGLEAVRGLDRDLTWGYAMVTLVH
jgi:hypothetical protein